MFNPFTDLTDIWIWFMNSPMTWIGGGLLLLLVLIAILKEIM